MVSSISAGGELFSNRVSNRGEALPADQVDRGHRPHMSAEPCPVRRAPIPTIPTVATITTIPGVSGIISGGIA